MGVRVVAAFAALAVGMLFTGAAHSATPAKRYLRFTADASFNYNVDYGREPDSVFNGVYGYEARVSVRAIAVYNGRSVSFLPGALVSSNVIAVKNMTQWAGRGSTRLQLECVDDEDGHYEVSTSLRASSGAYLSISSQGLFVNPGKGVLPDAPCSATESLVHHGLPSYPSISLPPPNRSRFNGRAPFAMTWQKACRHAAQGGLGRGVDAHAFEGNVWMSARFTPFAASKLAATQKELRRRLGTTAAAAQPAFPGYAACP